MFDGAYVLSYYKSNLIPCPLRSRVRQFAWCDTCASQDLTFQTMSNLLRTSSETVEKGEFTNRVLLHTLHFLICHVT